MSNSHLHKIQLQFGRQAGAYQRLPDVADERGMERLARFAQPSTTDMVLDVGCGPGFFTAALAKVAHRAVGLDGTPAFLRAAAAMGIENVHLILGDAAAMPIRDETFEIVACRAVFHHLPRPDVVLDEMVRVLKANGRILLADMITSEDPKKSEYHNRIERLCDPTHVRALSETEFERLFAALGLKVASRFKGPIEYQLDVWIAHGGPPPEAESQIRLLMERSIGTDRNHLEVFRRGEELYFRNISGVFLLTRCDASTELAR